MAEIESADMDEHQAEVAMAELRSKRKIWAQSKDLKKAMRTSSATCATMAGIADSALTS